MEFSHFNSMRFKIINALKKHAKNAAANHFALPAIATLSLLSIFSFLISCKKNAFENVPAHSGQAVTAKGQAIGMAVTKTIGAAGGFISSADGNLTVAIPAGALANEETIEVQEVTNTLPGGHNKIYRLAPHNIAFLKPAQLTLKYNADSFKNTVPQLLGMAYQNENGKWFFAAAPAISQSADTLTVMTTHFSDWGVMAYAYLEPSDPHVEPGAALELKLMCTVPETELDLPVWGEMPLYQPYEMHPDFVGQWDYAGEGSLDGFGSRAQYQAPNKVPEVNPEAVSVQIKSKSKGKFILVSNITINNGFQIDYMKVDEAENNSGSLNYESRLHIYGKFGLDPGKGKRQVKINNTEVVVAYWTPDKIVCDIPASGPNSSGKVTVTTAKNSASKLLNEWTVYLQYAEKQSPDGSLTKKAIIALRLRGDAHGKMPSTEIGDFAHTEINAQSNCLIDMPPGIFKTHTAADGCGDYTVTWDAVHNLVLGRKSYNGKGDGLYGTLECVDGGFNVKLRFQATDALMTHREFAGCRSGYSLDHVRETIQLQQFTNTVISLRFTQAASSSPILPGELPSQITSPAAGLYWDAVAYPANAFKVSMEWATAQPKF